MQEIRGVRPEMFSGNQLALPSGRSSPPYLSEEKRRDAASTIPKGKDWPSLLARDGDELEIHYRHTLEELGKRSGMLGVIFRKAQNKIQDPAMLRRLIAPNTAFGQPA
jgi:type I restriction enzyme M protein